MSEHKHIAIIGAGAAGLTAAYQLMKGGAKVEVFEAAPYVGGLARSMDLWGQRVDMGPHRFFSNDARVNRFWLEIAGKDYRMVDRLTRIFYKNKFFYYPLKPGNAFTQLGAFESINCGLSYFIEKFLPTKQDGSFETWVQSRFGKRLYEVFFKTYSEKLWGIPCTELDADFAAQRIKGLSLGEALKNAIHSPKKTKHKTLVDQFAFPTEGTGMIYERLKEKIEAGGGKVHLSTPIHAFVKEDDKVVGIRRADGEEKKFDHIISTMPLTLMVKGLSDVPKDILDHAAALKFRNTILVFLEVKGKDLFPDNWLYVHSDNLQTGRITNFGNWVPELNKGNENTIIAMEYWCYDEDRVWGEDEEELIALAREEIKETGLLNGAEVLQGYVEKLHRCYPVYSLSYRTHLEPLEKFISSLQGITAIGRYGAFKYNNQDHSILMGLLAAENILNDSGHDLWAVNTDYDAYQESSRITETGLVVE